MHSVVIRLNIVRKIFCEFLLLSAAIDKQDLKNADTIFNLITAHTRISPKSLAFGAGLGGSVGCAVRLETRRSRVQPPPRSATFFRGD